MDKILNVVAVLVLIYASIFALLVMPGFFISMIAIALFMFSLIRVVDIIVNL